MNTQQLQSQIVQQLDARTPMKGLERMRDHASAEQLVWWGCLCGWSVWRPVPPKEIDQSLSIAARWVMQGDEGIRQQARSQAKSAQSGPCQLLLNAVGFSGGVLQPEGSPVAAEIPNLAGNYVYAFVLELMAKHSAIDSLQVCQTFLMLAVDALAAPLPTSVRKQLVTA